MSPEIKPDWYTTDPEGVFIKAIKDKYNYSIRSITLAEQTGVAAVVKFAANEANSIIINPNPHWTHMPACQIMGNGTLKVNKDYLIKFIQEQKNIQLAAKNERIKQLEDAIKLHLESHKNPQGAPELRAVLNENLSNL